MAVKCHTTRCIWKKTIFFKLKLARTGRKSTDKQYKYQNIQDKRTNNNLQKLNAENKARRNSYFYVRFRDVLSKMWNQVLRKGRSSCSSSDPVVLLLLTIRWKVIKEKRRTKLWLRQTKYIGGILGQLFGTS